MGVVKITENLGEGRYKIELVKNVERTKALKALLEKHIEKLKAEIKELEKKLPDLVDKIGEKQVELELARQKFIDDTDNVAYLETLLNTLNQTIEQLEKRLKSEKETKAAIDKIIDGGNVSSNMTLGGFPIINDLGGALSATRRASKAKIKDLLTPTAEGPPVGEIVANKKRRKCAALAFNYREVTTADILATRLATKGKFKDFNIGPGVSTEIGLEAYSRRTKVVAKGEIYPTQPKISKKEFLVGDLTATRKQIKGFFKTEKLATDEPIQGELKAYRKGVKPLITIIHAGTEIEGKVEASRKATKGRFKDAAPPESDRPSSEILATRKSTDANISGELVLKTQQQGESYYQAVSDSKQDVIDGLNQRLSELTQEKNEILNQIKDLRDPTDLLKEYEQILSEMTQVIMTKQGIETNIKKSEITLDKKEKLQRDFDKTITQPDIRPAWCVDYALDLYVDLDEIQRQADAIQVQIDNLKKGSYTTQNHLNDLISAGATNDDPTVKNIKAALKSNDEEITSLKFRKESILSSVYRLSVDINDENNHILIAPHTYEPIEKDVRDKETYISIKIAAKDKLDEDDNKLFNEITERENKIDAKYIKINEFSLQIAAIDVSSNPEEQTQRRKNLQEKIDKLRDEIHDLNREIIKLKREKNLNRSKADKLAKLILRLNEELVNLNNAISSPEKILKPKVTEKTPRFQPTQSSSPEAVFFNKSLLPGFQKWRPSFRLGVITAIHDNDLCDVTLEDARSSQQDLNINQHKLLYNVRIKYGTCNSGAFTVNDRVVVEFSEREQDRPTVIGFEDNPKPCGVLLTYVNYPESDRWFHYREYPKHTVNNTYKVGKYYWYNKTDVISWDEPVFQQFFGGSFYRSTLYVNGKPFVLERKFVVAAAIKDDIIAVIWDDDVEIGLYYLYHYKFEFINGQLSTQVVKSVFLFHGYVLDRFPASAVYKRNNFVTDISISEDLKTYTLLTWEQTLMVFTLDGNRVTREDRKPFNSGEKVIERKLTGEPGFSETLPASSERFYTSTLNGGTSKRLPSTRLIPGQKGMNEVTINGYIEGGDSNIYYIVTGRLIGQKYHYLAVKLDSWSLNSFYTSETRITNIFTGNGSSSAVGKYFIGVYDIKESTNTETFTLKTFNLSSSCSDSGSVFLTGENNFFIGELLTLRVCIFDPVNDFYSYTLTETNMANDQTHKSVQMFILNKGVLTSLDKYNSVENSAPSASGIAFTFPITPGIEYPKYLVHSAHNGYIFKAETIEDVARNTEFVFKKINVTFNSDKSTLDEYIVSNDLIGATSANYSISRIYQPYI